MEHNAEAQTPLQALTQTRTPRTETLGEDNEDKVDGEPIDFSKHTYGGLGTLHDGARLLHNPWGRAGPATFATMQRRAEEQRAWVPVPPAFKESLLPQFGLHPQTAALATMMCLGRNVRMRTSFMDTSYGFVSMAPERNEGVLVKITALKFSTRVELKQGDMACMNVGECVIGLAEGVSRATLVRWPELSSHPSSAEMLGRALGRDISGNAEMLGQAAAASRKQRTCAACGQVWHQTMRRCAACNEVVLTPRR
jgi:hypothetical protein